ncbi:hypothetical protein PVAP13_5KG648914 [Panicum virgatum]|uniref:Uncharacterized protein n=1 Tax=Panicum virgatum TaxID=38727 RepID=A0A8T0SYQ7_PANVG|nr:hypothetical protein PVAP13_5KG648914 [Panicum virgatum]
MPAPSLESGGTPPARAPRAHETRAGHGPPGTRTTRLRAGRRPSAGRSTARRARERRAGAWRREQQQPEGRAGRARGLLWGYGLQSTSAGWCGCAPRTTLARRVRRRPPGPGGHMARVRAVAPRPFWLQCAMATRRVQARNGKPAGSAGVGTQDTAGGQKRGQGGITVAPGHKQARNTRSQWKQALGPSHARGQAATDVAWRGQGRHAALRDAVTASRKQAASPRGGGGRRTGKRSGVRSGKVAPDRIEICRNRQLANGTNPSRFWVLAETGFNYHISSQPLIRSLHFPLVCPPLPRPAVPLEV